ncbi:MAG TPA: Holliday junction resolvase RuvX [Chromatiales bacterium]|nr:Holliday junction resolvase RuvX [Chromatiales bacterium]
MPGTPDRRRGDTLMGFDYGPRKIGVAVGQQVTNTASPLTTLRAVQDKPDWAGIGALIEEWRPSLLIVGLPLNMDGSEMPLTGRARRFARQLEGRYRLPVELVDERLSSRAARERMGGQIKSIEEIDAVAAQLILETWLSEHPQ